MSERGERLDGQPYLQIRGSVARHAVQVEREPDHEQECVRLQKKERPRSFFVEQEQEEKAAITPLEAQLTFSCNPISSLPSKKELTHSWRTPKSLIGAKVTFSMSTLSPPRALILAA